ncbi:unnamed protein product [marine sediment metagenome]|uniref:Uncharacterized protein n=1 Tax=marine sediment metagenome TaxID=412755 RepID=X1CS96_9ZZZZ
MWNREYIPTPEKEDELIEKIATYTIQFGLEIPAIVVLESIKPLARLTSMLGIIFISPWITMLTYLAGKEDWGISGMNILIMIREKGNIEKLLQRIEGLVEEDKIKKKEEKLREKAEKLSKPRKSWKERFGFS